MDQSICDFDEPVLKSIQSSKYFTLIQLVNSISKDRKLIIGKVTSYN